MTGSDKWHVPTLTTGGSRSARFYDITAWSLPLLVNVGAYGSTDGRGLPARRLGRETRVASIPNPQRAGYAYLLDGRQAAALSALTELTARGYRVAVTLKPTRLDGAEVASGTVVIRVGQNDQSVHEAVREVARRFSVDVRAVGTGLSEPGFPALGSADVIPVRHRRGLRAALSRRVHAHAHRHDGVRHVHFHVHDSATPHAAPAAHTHSHAPLVVGTLHGLAGSAHVLGVLPALAFPSAVEAATYLAAFAAGGVTAMAAFSALLGWTVGRLEAAGLRAYRGFLSASSCAAIAVGGIWILS